MCQKSVLWDLGLRVLPVETVVDSSEHSLSKLIRSWVCFFYPSIPERILVGFCWNEQCSWFVFSLEKYLECSVFLLTWGKQHYKTITLLYVLSPAKHIMLILGGVCCLLRPAIHQRKRGTRCGRRRQRRHRLHRVPGRHARQATRTAWRSPSESTPATERMTCVLFRPFIEMVTEKQVFGCWYRIVFCVAKDD